MKRCFLILLLCKLLSTYTYGQNEVQVLDENIALADKLKFSEPEKSLKLALYSLTKSKKLNLYKRHLKIAVIIGHIYTDNGDFNNAIKIFDDALTIGKVNNLSYELANAETYFGNLYLKIGMYHKALIMYKRAHKYFDKTNDYAGMIKTITNSAICQMFLNNYDTASTRFHKALTLAENKHKIKEQGLINNNLGRLHLRKKEFTRAKKYFLLSIGFLKQSGKLNSVFRSKLLLAEIDFHDGKIQQAYQEAKSAYDSSFILKDFQNIVRAKKLIAEVHLYQGNLNEAVNQFQDAISLGKKYKIRQNLMSAQISFLKCLLNHGKFNLADQLFEEAIKLATFLNSAEGLIEIHELKGQRYELVKEFEEAYRTSQKRESIIDSINQFEKYELIERLEQEYNHEKKEYALSLQILKDKQAIIWLVLAIVTISVLFLSIILVYSNRQKNAKLKFEMNEAILRKKNLEIQKNKELESVNAEIKGQESERKRLARELHDGLGGTLTSIKWSLSQLNVRKNDIKALEKVVNRLDSACQEVRSISHHLMPKFFEETSLVSAVENYLQEIGSNPKLEISLEVYPEDEIENISNQLKNDIYRLIQELSINTLKHAQAQTLEVQIIMHDDYISLIVEDNGIGFAQDKVNKGIGLENMKSRILLYNGKYNIDSKLNRGTLIDISIPIN